MNKVIIIVTACWVIVPLIYSLIAEAQPHLRTVRAGTGQSASYFITGLLGQPTPAFQFMEQVRLDPQAQDTIIYIDYVDSGVNYSQIYGAISRDLKQHGYQKVKIFGISVGCAITHDFNLHSADFPDIQLECYEINPCWTSQFLRPVLQGKLPACALALLGIADFIIGPLKYIPLIKNGGESFSIHLFYRQLQRVLDGSASFAPTGKSQTQLVILSEKDDVLDNQRIAEYYAGTPIITLPGVEHARSSMDTSGAEYAAAFNRFLGETSQ